MNLIRPTTITDNILTACNVPEDDYPDWSDATAYTSGNLCMYGHKIYECLVGHTNAQPDLNTGGTTPKWLDLGFNNRWRMFDTKTGTRTVHPESIIFTVQPGLIDSIALLDLDATTLELTFTDPVEGVVYSDTVTLVSASNVVDAYSYFFEPFLTTDALTRTNLPPYGGAALTVAINAPGGVASVGTVVVGRRKGLGVVQYGAEIGITDYSQIGRASCRERV